MLTQKCLHRKSSTLVSLKDKIDRQKREFENSTARKNQERLSSIRLRGRVKVVWKTTIFWLCGHSLTINHKGCRVENATFTSPLSHERESLNRKSSGFFKIRYKFKIGRRDILVVHNGVADKNGNQDRVRGQLDTTEFAPRQRKTELDRARKSVSAKGRLNDTQSLLRLEKQEVAAAAYRTCQMII